MKDILEIIYFLCAPFLVFAAIYGLNQIKETKKTRKIQSTRESYTLAAEQCKYYMEIIIPLLNDLNELIDNNNLDFFKKTTVNIEHAKIRIKIFKDNDAIDKVIKSCLGEVNNACNLLEGFSVYFTSGVASESVAFRTVGNTFVSSVKKLLPFIMIVEGHYDNIKKLFFIWYNKNEKIKLSKQKELLEKKLEENREFVINTIGTK